MTEEATQWVFSSAASGGKYVQVPLSSKQKLFCLISILLRQQCTTNQSLNHDLPYEYIYFLRPCNIGS